MENTIRSVSVGEDGLHFGVGSHSVITHIEPEWKTVESSNDNHDKKILVYRGYNKLEELVFEIEANNKLQIIYK